MKRFALAFFVLALFLSNLAAEAASATFATRRGEIFQLILDGRLINGRGSNQVKIDRLPAGPHSVEFRLPARHGFLTFCDRIFLERGFETNYILIPPGYQPNFLLKKVSLVRFVPPVCNTCPPRPHGNANYNSYDVPDDYDYYQNQQGNYNNQGGNYGNNSNGNNYGSGNYGNNFNSGNNAPGQAFMSRNDADQLIETIRNANFESSKLDIAKQALNNSTILADDVKRIMGAFGFESTRLDFAKFAYPHVYDPQNFYRINDAFDFESSISEMQRWLKK